MTGEREAPGSRQHPAGFLGPGQDWQRLEMINSCEQGLHAPAAARNGPGERLLHVVRGVLRPPDPTAGNRVGFRHSARQGRGVRKSINFKEGNGIFFFFFLYEWHMSEDNELELGMQYPHQALHAVSCTYLS